MDTVPLPRLAKHSHRARLHSKVNNSTDLGRPTDQARLSGVFHSHHGSLWELTASDMFRCPKPFYSWNSKDYVRSSMNYQSNRSTTNLRSLDQHGPTYMVYHRVAFQSSPPSTHPIHEGLQLQALKHQHRVAPQGVRQLLRPTASHEVLRELHQTDEACTDACWASCVWRSLQLAGVVGGRIGGLRKNQWMCIYIYIYIINYNCTKCGECILLFQVSRQRRQIGTHFHY